MTTDACRSTNALVAEGQYAMVRKLGGDHIRSMKITAKQNILIEKLKVNSDSLIGKPFGLFEVVAGNASSISYTTLEGGDSNIDSLLECPSNGGNTFAPSGDQAMLNEAQARQRYSEEQIEEMKKTGTSTSELVSKLVEGSATFQARTEYAKSKYIRKKTRKHSDRLLILRPTVRLLCESFYKKDSERVGNLRWDQLGLILQLAGIHSGKRVVLFEQACGLLTSAVRSFMVIERLGGRGSVVHIHRGLQPQSIPCVHSMNYTEEILATLHPLRIDTLLNGGTPLEERDLNQSSSNGTSNVAIEDPISDPAGVALAALRRADRANLQKSAYGLVLAGFDALLIASRTVDPVSILEVLYDSLRPCGTIVIYGHVLQPLVEAHSWLRAKGAVNIQIQEQMFRIHQVLPQRTHPLMSQMVVGGVVVSAIKVVGPPPVTSTTVMTKSS